MISETIYNRLISHSAILESWQRDQCIPSGRWADMQDLSSIRCEALGAGPTDMACPECVADMLRDLINARNYYRTQMDANAKLAEAVIVPEVILPEYPAKLDYDGFAFLVYAPPFDRNSGGNLALHKLAGNLKAIGMEANIFGSYAEGGTKGKAITIYPEIISGNPLGAKYVVRWLLNHPGVLGGDGIYGENDLVFKFANHFKAPDESKVSGILTAWDIDFDLWVNRKESTRTGKTYLKRKGKTLIPPLIESTHIRLDGLPHEEMARYFNGAERFYSYDYACMFSCFAAMCGCLSIVHPVEGMTAEEWRSGLPYMKYGIAYGDSKKEINYAKRTAHRVSGHLKEMIEISIQQTKDFVEICNQKFNQ